MYYYCYTCRRVAYADAWVLTLSTVLARRAEWRYSETVSGDGLTRSEARDKIHKSLEDARSAPRFPLILFIVPVVAEQILLAHTERNCAGLRISSPCRLTRRRS